MYSSRIMECAVAYVLLSKGLQTHAFNSSDGLLAQFAFNLSSSFDVSRKGDSLSVHLAESRPSLSPTRSNLESLFSTPSPTVFATLRASKSTALTQFNAGSVSPNINVEIHNTPRPSGYRTTLLVVDSLASAIPSFSLTTTTMSPSAASLHSSLSPAAESDSLIPTRGKDKTPMGAEIVVPPNDLHSDSKTNTETRMPVAAPISLATLAPSRQPTGIPSTFQTIISNRPTQTLLSMKPTSSPHVVANHVVDSTPSLSDVDLQPLEFYRNRSFNIICSVFFPMESVLGGQDVNTLERTTKEFVIDHVGEINLPIVVVSVQDVTVVSQVFAWKRPKRLRGLQGAATGLNVYFQIVLVVTGYTTNEELENSIQELFHTYDSVFRNSLDFSSAKETSKNTLYPVRMMLGIVAGCSGLVALTVTATMFARKKKREINRKREVGSDKEHPKLGQKPVQYAMQELSQRDRAVQFGWDDVSSSRRSSNHSCEPDDMSCDDSFSASLVFCPSVDRQNLDVKELACGQGIVRHKDQEVPRDETVTTTVNHKKTKNDSNTRLSKEALDNFDDELRRAEC